MPVPVDMIKDDEKICPVCGGNQVLFEYGDVVDCRFCEGEGKVKKDDNR